ncbi:hypothetical protein KFE25_008162 [Diacronema lutheri]|uniref:Uncharacterized protein n=1 Tax=Diacronema lutheri TaxID=2081491 RepID=A0A8J5XL24_DIALT|nr:hypothetical protein KFE25_008162 [Diacronema lutheri]
MSVAEPPPPTFNSGDGLYTEDAPYGSVVHGDDYGRTSALRARGVIVTPSTLEMLSLGSSCTHMVTVKVIAYSSDAIARERLRGHVIIFPHERVDLPAGADFGLDAIKGALAHVRVLFVGPAGRRTALERAALHVPDLRLDACVVYNFLALRHALHGNKAPPPLAQLEALFALHGIQKYIVANARVSHDETLERVCDGTDVAGVRAHAASAAQARAADPEEVAAAARAEADDAPEMRTFGALAAPAQSMGQVLAAIASAVSPDNPAMAAAQAANASEHAPAGAPAGAKPCTQQRGETPRDDYGGAATALYDTF